MTTDDPTCKPLLFQKGCRAHAVDVWEVVQQLLAFEALAVCMQVPPPDSQCAAQRPHVHLRCEGAVGWDVKQLRSSEGGCAVGLRCIEQHKAATEQVFGGSVMVRDFRKNGHVQHPD